MKSISIPAMNKRWSHSEDGCNKEFRFLCVLPPPLSEAGHRRAEELGVSFNQYINHLLINAEWSISDSSTEHIHILPEEKRTVKVQLLLSAISKLYMDSQVLESKVSKNELICRLIDKDLREANELID